MPSPYALTRRHFLAASGAVIGLGDGGVVGGRVIGKSDKVGGQPVTTSNTPYDVGATIYHAMGIDPESEIRDAQNRPSRVCAGTPMDILFQNR